MDDMSRSIQGCRPAAEAAAGLFAPIGSRQAKSQEAFARLAKINDVLRSVQCGMTNERQAILLIEEIATGAANSLFVGDGYRPDIQTTREGDK